VAKEASAKNIRISAEAYRMLTLAAALVGGTKSDYASRAILAAAAKDVPERWPEAGGGKGPRAGRKGRSDPGG
jgi:hypothetical protein